METEARSVSRRDVLTKGILAGGVGAAAGVLVTATGAGCARAQEQAQTNLTWDVACLGDTLRIQPTEGNEEGDLSGNTFYVEGNIYQEGTIKGTGFDPASAEPVGIWICRGWFMIKKERPEPHVVTTQEYVFGDIRKDRLFPPDALTSSGTEGTDARKQTPIRSVIGGTGRYAGASGVVLQRPNGDNTTVLRGPGVKAPNFRFVFALLIPEIQLPE